MTAYLLRTRFLAEGEGWQCEVDEVAGSYEFAGRAASARARELDEKYGDGHFWTVDLQNPDGESFFQLFHGRLA